MSEATGHCPMCGRAVYGYGLDGHECPKRTISAIDAAHDAAEIEPQGITPAVSYGTRLADGFRALDGKVAWIKPGWR